MLTIGANSLGADGVQNGAEGVHVGTVDGQPVSQPTQTCDMKIGMVGFPASNCPQHERTR